jgi:UDP-2,3-diacylglucosamine pyrophosphatase LpxH
MLALVSDLHFRDGTAGEHNVPARAFEGILEDLATHARHANAKEVVIIFLGDIFDLLRTEAWLEAPESERPWGVTPESYPRMAKRAEDIMDALLGHPLNRETFALLGSDLKQRFPSFPEEPIRVFIPGNHDRLCAEFPLLMEKALRALGAEGHEPLHFYMSPRYGVLARHGHEYDPFNCEGCADGDDPDYLKVPIGDPVAAELVVRLPYTVMRHPKVRSLPDKEQISLRRSLQEIESVRPLSAIPKWLYYQIQRQGWLEDVIEESLDQVVHEFEGLAFVQDWYRRHDRPSSLLDNADQLQALLFFLDKLRITRLGWLFSLAETVRSSSRLQPLARAAQREFESVGTDTYYVIYGHTHVPAQEPVAVLDGTLGTHRDRVYLNTGSWGTVHKEAMDSGFVSWRQLTYVLIYDETEDLPEGRPPRGFPAFETWSGTLKRAWSWPPTEG